MIRLPLCVLLVGGLQGHLFGKFRVCEVDLTEQVLHQGVLAFDGGYHKYLEGFLENRLLESSEHAPIGGEVLSYIQLSDDCDHEYNLEDTISVRSAGNLHELTAHTPPGRGLSSHTSSTSDLSGGDENPGPSTSRAVRGALQNFGQNLSHAASAVGHSVRSLGKGILNRFGVRQRGRVRERTQEVSEDHLQHGSPQVAISTPQAGILHAMPSPLTRGVLNAGGVPSVASYPSSAVPPPPPPLQIDPSVLGSSSESLPPPPPETQLLPSSRTRPGSPTMGHGSPVYQARVEHNTGAIATQSRPAHAPPPPGPPPPGPPPAMRSANVPSPPPPLQIDPSVLGSSSESLPPPPPETQLLPSSRTRPGSPTMGHGSPVYQARVEHNTGAIATQSRPALTPPPPPGPPPAMRSANVPPPPGPPPPMQSAHVRATDANNSNTRSTLFSAIRTGTQLRPVERDENGDLLRNQGSQRRTSNRSQRSGQMEQAASISRGMLEDPADIGAALQRAMTQRRFAVEESETSHETVDESENDDWDD